MSGVELPDVRVVGAILIKKRGSTGSVTIFREGDVTIVVSRPQQTDSTVLVLTKGAKSAFILGYSTVRFFRRRPASSKPSTLAFPEYMIRQPNGHLPPTP